MMMCGCDFLKSQVLKRLEKVESDWAVVISSVLWQCSKHETQQPWTLRWKLGYRLLKASQVASAIRSD